MNMKNLLQVEMVMVEKLEGKRAKVVGACVIAYGKFQPSGISEI